jgi:hypothetical protein
MPTPRTARLRGLHHLRDCFVYAAPLLYPFFHPATARFLYRNVGSNPVIHVLLMLMRQCSTSANKTLYNNARLLFIEKNLQADLSYEFNFHGTAPRLASVAPDALQGHPYLTFWVRLRPPTGAVPHGCGPGLPRAARRPVTFADSTPASPFACVRAADLVLFLFPGPHESPVHMQLWAVFRLVLCGTAMSRFDIRHATKRVGFPNPDLRPMAQRW